jgi:hypothetical protein
MIRSSDCIIGDNQVKPKETIEGSKPEDPPAVQGLRAI